MHQFCSAPETKFRRVIAEERSEMENNMTDINGRNRPRSPHLQIYRPQLTYITSILTRITGNAFVVGAILVVWWLLAAATGPQYFAFVNGDAKGKVKLSYRNVHEAPLTTEAEGGISLKRIVPKTRVY